MAIPIRLSNPIEQSTKMKTSKSIHCLASALALTLGLASDYAPAQQSQPYHWQSAKIVIGGFIPGIIFSPKQPGLCYVRTDIGGVYRWDAAEKHWTPLTDWCPLSKYNLMGGESVAPDPVDANKVYIAGGMYSGGKAAILRSNDQGRTFDVVYVPFVMGGNEDGRGVGERLDIDPNDTNVLYFGSRYDGLWSSTDSAKTWAKVDSFPHKGTNRHQGWGTNFSGAGIGFIVFDPRSGSPGNRSQIIYVGVSENSPDHLYRSTDAGKTWEAVPSQPKGMMAVQSQLDSDGSLYVTYGAGQRSNQGAGPNDVTKGAVFKFDTKSGAWTDITPEHGGFGYAGLSIDRQHVGTLVVTTIDRWGPVDDVFRSTDGGKSWKSVAAHSQRDWSLSPYLTWNEPAPKFGWWTDALAIDPFDSNHCAYGTGATIWATDDLTRLDSDQTTHWSVWGEGIEETAVIDLMSPSAGAHLVTGLGDIGGFVHNDLTVSPPVMPKNPQLGSGESLDFAENNPAILVRVGRGQQGQSGGYSLDSGATWTLFPHSPGNRDGGAIAISADGDKFVWAPQGGTAGVSSDRGATWAACKGLFNNARPVSDRVNPNKFYAMDFETGRIYVSTDGGLTFTSHLVPSTRGDDNRLRATPGHEGDLWFTRAGGLYHSTDSGATFSKISSISYAVTIGFGKAPDGKDYPALFTTGTVNGVEGIFRSDDAANSWIRINDDQHQYGAVNPVIGDPRIFGRVYIGTNGRGVLYADPAQ
jgi:xyloglucan-specific exo-beta-1,4-glucanase